MNKYNANQVVRAVVSEHAIENLLGHDKIIHGPPRFITDFLHLKPSRHRETLGLRPELITWTKDKLYLIMPNPSQTDHGLLLKDPKLIKYREEGFGFIAWYIHPYLYKESQFASLWQDKILQLQKNGESLRYGHFLTQENFMKHAPTLFGNKKITGFSDLMQREEDKETVGSIISRSNIPYISGPLDYTIQDLPSLYQLKQTIEQFLVEQLHIIPTEDHIELYFHSHYSISTTTSHLHIRVNQLRHPLELDKSYSLNSIIEHLEQKKQGIRYQALERGVVHKELKSEEFLKARGYETQVIRNPYLLHQA